MMNLNPSRTETIFGQLQLAFNFDPYIYCTVLYYSIEGGGGSLCGGSLLRALCFHFRSDVPQRLCKVATKRLSPFRSLNLTTARSYARLPQPLPPHSSCRPLTNKSTKPVTSTIATTHHEQGMTSYKCFPDVESPP
jgi:hypothetical protein